MPLNARRLATVLAACLAPFPWTATVSARPVDAWQSKHRDIHNTGRADFVVPVNRQGSDFFDILAWQKPSPGSPGEGSLGGSSMVFFDGAGPVGADVVVGGFHWPKGVQGMDRHTGRLLWQGNPSGGETIGESTPAFSNDGTTVYVVNDATDSPQFPLGHPLMAFASITGPAQYRHNGTDGQPDNLTIYSPKVSPDGRIFLHAWVDRPYAGADNGNAITRTWAAATPSGSGLGDVALYNDAGTLKVIAGGRTGVVKCYNGTTGAELWSAMAPTIDASPTADPVSGHIYLPAGSDSIWAVGLDKNGGPLWAGGAAAPVYAYVPGESNPQRAQSAGCLSHDGSTYYFQTNSMQGDGVLYALNTATGRVRWTFATHSLGWEGISSSPIVTPNGIIVVGNNGGNTYYALRDDGSIATMLDSVAVLENAGARATASLSANGILYLPMRLTWSASNGDGEAPTFQAANLFCAADLRANAQVILPPPAGQAARALNHAVALNWQPVPDPTGAFGHYAVYRGTTPFESVAGMTPIGTVGQVAAGSYTDGLALNGVSYHYAVTTVTTQGAEVQTVASIGPRTPRDETDLQVICVARTPRYPRYDAQYSVYQVTEQGGFGPYSFSAATGLGSGQTAGTQRWPNPGDAVGYTATIRNRGTNPWNSPVMIRWDLNGNQLQQAPASLSLVPGATQEFSVSVPWNAAAQDEIRFSVVAPDARPANNTLSVFSKSVAYLSYVDTSYIENFRESTRDYPGAASDDVVDWLNRHMARFNQLFADAGTTKRVHFDVLRVLGDADPDPSSPPSIDFAIFPFRYQAGDGSLRLSGYYSPSDDYDYGLLHEMGHQLGLIDLYRLNVDPAQNLVNNSGYSTAPCLMNGVSHFISPDSAGAMTHWLDRAHGYFGQYLYLLPQQVRLRILGSDGTPLSGATVKLYQKCERPGMGEVITNQIKFQGTTDSQGYFTLPNVPIDHGLVPTTFADDSLPDNPFGYVAVVGSNGVFLIRVEDRGFADYAWLDIVEANDAYWAGQTGVATFTRQVALGGTLQRFPPDDMAELNAASWARWSQDGVIIVADDTDRRQVGRGSIRVDTTGGFDNYVRYPGDQLARWDLSGATALRAWFYAIDLNNPQFQNGSPWIRLHGPDGFIELHPTFDILNQALGQWREFVIPLAGDATWQRSVSGVVSLDNISGVEIHADTWGAGFTLWVDGVRFEPPPCRADWNGSGAVNSQDFFDFLTDFFNDDAEFNGDGLVNSQDFFDFLATFFAGCP
jgi:hypothetical protein